MYNDSDEQRPSKQRKQQQKREAEAAQALGDELIKLPAAQFNRLIDKLDLPENLPFAHAHPKGRLFNGRVDRAESGVGIDQDWRQSQDGQRQRG